MNHQLWQAFRLLSRSPAFGRFWLGRLISLFGDAFTLIALPWFVLQLTGSGTATAGILLTLQLPAILTSLVLGSLIDRFQPRTIMAIDNGLRALIVGLIPILHWLGLLELWLLFLLTFLAGMLVPATEVGSRSILPDLVDDKDLDAANMLWSLSTTLSLVVGPAVAGLLVAAEVAAQVGAEGPTVGAVERNRDEAVGTVAGQGDDAAFGHHHQDVGAQTRAVA